MSSVPKTFRAVIATNSASSVNQALSFWAFFAPDRPALPLVAELVAVSLLTIVCTSWISLAIVTLIFSGSLSLSLHCSRLTVSVIVVPYPGSGTRHFFPSRMLSSGSPVSRLRSSPVTLTVT